MLPQQQVGAEDSHTAVVLPVKASAERCASTSWHMSNMKLAVSVQPVVAALVVCGSSLAALSHIGGSIIRLKGKMADEDSM